MLDALDAAALREWSCATVEALDAHRDEIDALNVFPVADADTGANMLATVRAAHEALTSVDPPDPAAVLAALADGAAAGALGNSGFITSQILRGLADAARGQPHCDGPTLARGLDLGADLARAAVVEPVDGTMLTVARAAADGAQDDRQGAKLADVVVRAVEAADAALQRTPTQLPVLARAGVVDAGGRGLVIMLAELARAVTGSSVSLTPVLAPHRAAAGTAPGPGASSFEVQYRIDATGEAMEGLRTTLATVGDSVAVLPTGPNAWNVHVHVADVGAAIEAGLAAGRPHQISVVPLELHAVADGFGVGEGVGAAVLAVAPGPGLAHLFERAGVHVVQGGADDLPSVEDVVTAIDAIRAGELVLLPNAARVAGVAEDAAARVREAGIRVSVVPTRSPVQGLAAAAVHDPARRFEDDVVAMAEAAAATRHAELSVAASTGLTAVGICEPGDVLGLIDDEVVEIGRGVLAVAFTVVDRLLGVGAELMTVLVGADAPPTTGELIRSHVRNQTRFTDVVVYDGGQRDHLVIIGVE